MRACRGIFALSMLFAGGCANSSMLMGVTGSGQVPLATRDQVHDAFGVPATAGTIDGTRFEEFEIAEGCGIVVNGYRVALDQPFEEFRINWDDARLTIEDDGTELPTKGKNLVVVGTAYGLLRFRLFDLDGKMVVDTDETNVPNRSGPMADLKKQLANLWPGHEMTAEESYQIMSSVAAIVGKSPVGTFELGVATVKTCGLMQAVILPSAEADPNRRRVSPGQKLRFDFDDAGNVVKVYQNGKYLMSPKRTDSVPEHGCFIVFMRGFD